MEARIVRTWRPECAPRAQEGPTVDPAAAERAARGPPGGTTNPDESVPHSRRPRDCDVWRRSLAPGRQWVASIQRARPFAPRAREAAWLARPREARRSRRETACL